MNYYNEFNHEAASWLRELINDGLIPYGHVDERSIKDVRADDLRGYTQCHFFAGIGGWSLAIKLSGWPDGEEIWTGSCPCQPYSSAGKQLGNEDERDLWPEFFRLISERKPKFVFGEQVESSIRFNWLDRVYSDMEREGYALGSAILGAHSVGAPHRRYRLYWGGFRVAEDSDGWRCGRRSDENNGRDNREIQTERLCVNGNMGNDERSGFNCTNGLRENKESSGRDGYRMSEENCDNIGMANGICERLERHTGDEGNVEESRRDKEEEARPASESCVSSFYPWRDYRLILCKDKKIRRIPFESILFSMDDGVPEGMDGCWNCCIQEDKGFPISIKKEETNMLIKGYGNAIVPQVAAEFLKSFYDVYTEINNK